MGLAKNGSGGAIKKAYRKLAQRHHAFLTARTRKNVSRRLRRLKYVSLFPTTFDLRIWRPVIIFAENI
jgi:hypothetical protein